MVKVDLSELTHKLKYSAQEVAFKIILEDAQFTVRSTHGKRRLQKAPRTNLAMSVSRLVEKNRDNYIGYLNALSNKLNAPGLTDLQATNPNIKLKFGKPLLSAGVSPHWNPLTEKTIGMKKAGLGANTYWKHTGALSKAFSHAVANQKSKWKLEDFVDSIEADKVLQNLAKGDKREFQNNQIQISFPITLKIPKWKGQGKSVMDSLVVEPYVGSSSSSTPYKLRTKNISKDTTERDKKAEDRRGKIAHRKAAMGNATGRVKLADLQELHRLQKELKQVYIADHFEKIKGLKPAYGLNRLLAPEHTRPFIQKLSAAAGKIARADLKNMA